MTIVRKILIIIYILLGLITVGIAGATDNMVFGILGLQLYTIAHIWILEKKIDKEATL